eukprot:TRINITY_DN1381_c0_g5_i2.p3 TRINITY_DN1381_c0_g5~~TRINITY_DN1381_c0_g5_i2.p3  ORF type:complete len:153 (+),score=55.05 TRINITY_DN1381_c0_g5_i2:69-527(+)
MDPTITVGNIFSAKGTQNHILSNQWKDTVRKEQQLHKGWKSKYAKGLIEREGELLNKSAEIDLLETNRKKMAPAGDSTVLYEDGKGRLPYLKIKGQQAPQNRFNKPLTASQEIGWHTGLRAANQDTLDVYAKTNWGLKPIVATSFFRPRGAM